MIDSTGTPTLKNEEKRESLVLDVQAWKINGAWDRDNVLYVHKNNKTNRCWKINPDENYKEQTKQSAKIRMLVIGDPKNLGYKF